MFKIERSTVALGAGNTLAGYTVTHDNHFVEFFKYQDQARRYVERKEEELTRDG